MSRDASELASAVEAICPINGVSIGRKDDRQTWRVDYAPSATGEQIAAAQSVLASFDFNAPSVPASVKMWQAKAALAASGKLEAANAAVQGAGGAVALAWEYAPDVSRASAAVAAMASAIGLSSADVDALFIAADAIQV